MNYYCFQKLTRTLIYTDKSIPKLIDKKRKNLEFEFTLGGLIAHLLVDRLYIYLNNLDNSKLIERELIDLNDSNLKSNLKIDHFMNEFIINLT